MYDNSYFLVRYVGDGCTFSCEVVVAVTAESKEEIFVAFNDRLENNKIAHKAVTDFKDRLEKKKLGYVESLEAVKAWQNEDPEKRVVWSHVKIPSSGCCIDLYEVGHDPIVESEIMTVSEFVIAKLNENTYTTRMLELEMRKTLGT